MSFWGRLSDYRERNCSRLLQICEDQLVTPKQASCILENFKYHELWYDLTWSQKRNKHWRSTVNAILHKRSGWTHAAKAIMEYDLPKLHHTAATDDATEHINALGQFALDLATWLRGFGSRLHEYRLTERYQQAQAASLAALKQRKKRDRE